MEGVGDLDATRARRRGGGGRRGGGRGGNARTRVDKPFGVQVQVHHIHALRSTVQVKIKLAAAIAAVVVVTAAAAAVVVVVVVVVVVDRRRWRQQPDREGQRRVQDLEVRRRRRLGQRQG
jgi:cytochrome c biogenesis protein ResB